MENIKISIIMPVYNVEKYLRKCFDSVLASTLKEIEIIAVDDGSKDSSGMIIDEYAAKDSRIIPVHKENGGYGKAINTGLNIARGEYVAILETDDWVNPTTYELLYSKAKYYNANCLKGNFNYCPEKDVYNKHKFIATLPLEKPFTLKEHPEILLIAPSIWSAIYKREFLKENNIKLTEKVTPYEDFPFACEVYSKIDKIILIDEPVYNYRCEQNQGSSTIRSDRKLFKIIDQINNTLEITESIGSLPYIKEAVFKHIYNCISLFVGNAADDLKQELFDEFSKIFNSDYAAKLKFTYFNKAEKQAVKYLKADNFKAFFMQKGRLTFLQTIFSIKNQELHKVITLLGIRIKFKRRNNPISVMTNNTILLKSDSDARKICEFPGINFDIVGKNNTIILHNGLIAKDINIIIKNDNCKIEIESSACFSNVNIVCVNGNGQSVYIGKNTSFAPFSRCQITLDDNSSLEIGNDCMFSNSIDIWATDGHTIYDLDSKKIINRQKHPLKIGNKCWIGEGVKIGKNARIPNNSIVGMGAVLTGQFIKEHTIIAGNPAKVVKENVSWSNLSTYVCTNLLEQ